MTLVHPLLEDWRRRLEVALEMAEVDARGSWFWRMRAKVLKYLIVRYAEELPSGSGGALPVPSHPVVLHLPGGAPPRPLRSPAVIRELLERIRGLRPD